MKFRKVQLTLAREHFLEMCAFLDQYIRISKKYCRDGNRFAHYLLRKQYRLRNYLRSIPLNTPFVELTIDDYDYLYLELSRLSNTINTFKVLELRFGKSYQKEIVKRIEWARHIVDQINLVNPMMKLTFEVFH